MQSQIICSGCRSILSYPREAASVFCALCNMLNSVPSPGNEGAHVVCEVCRTLLMYTHATPRVRCFQCYTINATRTANQVAHVACGHCRTPLIYPYGAASIKCALCHYITNLSSISPDVPVHRPNGIAPAPQCSSAQLPHNQIVIVENPISVNSSGKLVNNCVWVKL
ncbi:protein LSD1 [Canna indica]|uniref:Protein LSD1 n=1 Tax=Canna indica TaxID=4628 RepID=A0AAQ3QCE0_9LILI|nr:protein LSD1 [Canna indica]